MFFFSDDEEDTASAKLRTSAGQQSPKAVILINKNIAVSNAPYRLAFNLLFLFDIVVVDGVGRPISLVVV